MADLSGTLDNNVEISPLSSGIKSSAITLTTSGTKYALPTATISNRKSISIYNDHDEATVWVGASDVNVVTGYPVLPFTSLCIDAGEDIVIYGVSDTDAATVRVLEVA